LNEGASWKSAGRLSRKIGRRRKLETGRKAGQRIGKRRKSQVDAKAGPESWLETQVEGWLEGRPE
jgi:aromatic ring-cleaving dioxygenase